MKKLLLTLVLFTAAGICLPAQGHLERETLVYSIKDGQELHLDKYVDQSLEYEGRRPVMIYVHGGGFTTGSRINALQITYLKHFARQGFISIGIDYRLGIPEGVPQPDHAVVMQAVNYATEDLIDATAFILGKADEWNLDKEKIMISGGSAGAITCLNAEYEICTEGNFAARLPEGFNYAGIISHAGCIIVPGDTLVWKKAPCPMMLMHGSADQLVPFDVAYISGHIYAGSNYIHEQLSELDYSHWLYEETGADHIVALKPLQYNFREIEIFIDLLVMGGNHAIAHTQWADDEPDSMDKMFEVVPLYINGWGKTDEEVEAERQ